MDILRYFRATVPQRILGILLVVLLLLSVSLGLLYFIDPYRLTIAPDVSVGGVSLAGQSPFAAKEALEQALSETLYHQPLTVILPEETLTLAPSTTEPKVDTFRAIWDAFSVGRWGDGISSRITLTPYLTVNETALREVLADYAHTYDTTFRDSQWHLEGAAPELSTRDFDPEAPCQTLRVSVGVPEAHLNLEEAWKKIRSALDTAITACQEDTYSVSILVTPTKAPPIPDADAIAEAACVPVTDDSLDMQTYEFVHGSYGYQFDTEALRDMLQAAAYGDVFTLPMEYITPEILGDAVYFRDVLGSYETKHNENQNRNTNLKLLCEALDGHIVNPGEEFSYNGVVGERTAERGYKPAPAYSGNRLVDAIGGGVCQGSTTIYNCVLLADLEVVFRACHGASVGYVPKGLDAAVNFLTTDFKFRNNWNFPVMIKAEVSDGYVKMKILGTDEKDYYVKMETRWGEDDIAVYARSYKCKYDKTTDELISRDIEAYSTYYKNIG